MNSGYATNVALYWNSSGNVGFNALTVEALRELRAEKDAEIAGLKQTVTELKNLVANLAQKLNGDGQ